MPLYRLTASNAMSELWLVYTVDMTTQDSNCVHTTDKTVLCRLDPVSMTVLSCLRRRCEHNWRRDKTVLSCRVGGVNTIGDETKLSCLVELAV